MNVDAIDRFTLGGAGPTGRDERDAMPRTHEAPEHLVQVYFGSARSRVAAIEPVEDEDLQR